MRYLALDLDFERVRDAQQRGEPVYYADPTHEEALAHAHVADAAALVVLMDDLPSTRQTLAVARKLAPQVPILVRCRRRVDEARLVEGGATEVVCEGVEAGIELLARVLRRRGAPMNVIGPLVEEARARSGTTVRKVALPRRRLGDLRELDELRVEPVVITPAMKAVGETLPSLRFGRETGAHVVALRREQRLYDAVPADLALAPGDVLYLVGPREALYAGLELLQRGVAPVEEREHDDAIASE